MCSGSSSQLSALSSQLNPAERLLISEEWLKSVGFKWHEMERQGKKHWVLWLGHVIRDHGTDREDLGIELSASITSSSAHWFCWLRSDCAGRYHRFIHIRYLLYVDEVIAMIEGLTGQRWNPENNVYGATRTPEHAERLRKDSERLDQRVRKETKWSDIEKDDSRGGALPEHMQAAIDAGKAK